MKMLCRVYCDTNVRSTLSKLTSTFNVISFKNLSRSLWNATNGF